MQLNRPWGTCALALSLMSAPLLASEVEFIPMQFTTEFMDQSVDPAVDFNRYANGGWLDATEIPSDKSRWGAFDALAENNWRRIHLLLEEIAESDAPAGSNLQKVADFYRTAMDTAAIDAAGITPLLPTFEQIEAIGDIDDLADYVAAAHAGIGSPLFGLYMYADQRNNEDVIFIMVQGGLSLPTRDYYFDEQYAKYLPLFVDHMTTMFELAGTPTDQARADAETVLALETKLAGFSKTVTELRDPIENYHKMPIAEADALMPDFPLERYIRALGVPESETELDFKQPEFFAGLSEVLASEPLENIKTYLRWQALTSAAPYLASSFEQENFRFFSTELSGTPAQEPRWQRSARMLDRNVGFALGEVYVAKYFPPAVKDRLEEMIVTMRDVLHERIVNLDWMTEPTKEKALEKLKTFRVVVGYPPEWRDYSALTITDESLYANILASAQFETQRQLAKLEKPFDKSEWLRTPQQVNAYYQPSAGQLVFLAGILQPPYFDPELDDAVNYGAICAVIGHEITHGFDDKGRNYDAHGNLADWWTEADATEFAGRAQKLIDQYNSYEVLPEVFVNGEQTLGENIADLGGVSIALEALQRSIAGKEDPMIDGLTQEQRFFIAWSQVWRTKYRDDALKRTVSSNVHSPGMIRAIGPIVNVPEFYEAFGIKEGDPMWLPTAERAKIW
ncbi:M13 family metallopeptidase [Actomonas aquatica]|uniref:M13 family metallopeptidase n=1 Tax=Actomonas aquatica TaxID=2866162 RepID=A0ABZ1CBL3_9BACT|nr:M13 family metallopeptidase [Opitutus sp. WL0086]WRQ88775.1 M13 family metallopeptidase [Opitutus sp. WL0086]